MDTSLSILIYLLHCNNQTVKLLIVLDAECIKLAFVFYIFVYMGVCMYFHENGFIIYYCLLSFFCSTFYFILFCFIAFYFILFNLPEFFLFSFFFLLFFLFSFEFQ